MSEAPPRAALEREGSRRPRLSATWPIHPLLFAAYPALFLFSQNLADAYLGDLFPPLASTVAIALAATLIGAVVLRDLRKSALLVSALVVAIFWYGGIAEATVPLGMGLWPTWLILLGVVASALLGMFRLGSRLANATAALNVVGMVLVALTLVPIVPHQLGRLNSPGLAVNASGADAPSGSPSASGTPAAGSGTNRDIYYLIFDRYGSKRALELQFGFDNGPFYDWLRDHGFYVAEDSHANYVKTPISLAATLNLDYIDAVAERMGPASDDYSPLFEMMDDHAVGRFLKRHGYEYIHVGSYYGETQTSRIADVNTRTEGGTDFSRALSDSSLLSLLDTLEVPDDRPSTPRERANRRAYTYALSQFDELRQLRDRPGAQFVFAHILLPHPPYVFNADGSFTTPGVGSIPELFAGQVTFTNDQIKAIVEPLLQQPEEARPIIILQADEGPFPDRYAANEDGFDWTTATQAELETKFGILNAWYLPEGGQERLYPTISAVNTFRLLFSEYFGADLDLLPDRTWTSKGRELPYDLTEITERLPSLP